MAEPPRFNFKYSHTIQAQGDSKEDDLDELFKIGGEYIQKQPQPIDLEAVSSVQKHPPEKEKKIKKHRDKELKKQRKDKKKHRKTKQKRQKSPEELPIQNLQRRVCATNQVFTDPLQRILQSEFLYNEKLGGNLLPISVIKFPQKGLFEYGILAQTIPKYRRLKYNRILGYNVSLTVSTKIIKQLNIQINQVNHKSNDQESADRYFNYTFDDIKEVIHPLKTKVDANPYFVSFDNKEWATIQNLNSLKTLAIDYRSLDESQSELLKSNKQYNLKLGKEPNNVRLWLDFIDAQQTLITLNHSKESKGWLSERKLSILTKAMLLNPLSAQLKLKEIKLIYQNGLDDSYRTISRKCMEGLQNHPQNTELWEWYINYRFSHLSSFTDYSLRDEYKSILELLNRKINEAKSAMLVWNIRKALLGITYKMVNIISLQGYRQLATSLSFGLLEYNIFPPKEVTALTANSLRLASFQQYWQNINAYRIGEVGTLTSWGDCGYSLNDSGEYIGVHQQRCSQISQSCRMSGQNWRPARTVFDDKRILQSPYSYVLFQDIEHYLQAIKDKHNIQRLVDVVVECFGFPPVFSDHNRRDSPFMAVYLLNKCLRTISTKQSSALSQSSKTDFWLKFWHPEETSLLMNSQFCSKFLYLKRVLTYLKPKLQSSAIDLYLLFIESVLYLNPALLDVFYSEQECKHNLSRILQDNPSSVEIWVGYINTEYLKSGNKQECLGVYCQLLQGASQPESVFQLLYYMLVHTSQWQYKLKETLRVLLVYLIEGRVSLPTAELVPLESLQLLQVLTIRYKQLEVSQQQGNSLGHFFRYFLSLCCSIYQPAGDTVQVVRNIIYKCGSTLTDKDCLLLLRTQRRLRINPSSSHLNDSIVASECVLKGYEQPIFMLRSDTKPTLRRWLQMLVCLRHPTSSKVNYFIEMGLEISLQQDPSNMQPNVSLAFGKLARQMGHEQFCRDMISKMPYCKQLFEMVIEDCETDHEKQKYRKLLDEKMLRV